MSIQFSPWERLFLQDCISRWSQYKGLGNFSDAEMVVIESIRTKIQVVDDTPTTLTTEENDFLEQMINSSKEISAIARGSQLYTSRIISERSEAIIDSILRKLSLDNG